MPAQPKKTSVRLRLLGQSLFNYPDTKLRQHALVYLLVLRIGAFAVVVGSRGFAADRAELGKDGT